MTNLNLAELDKLEQEMQSKVMSTNVGKIHEQLRPLLDLVDRLGEGFDELLQETWANADVHPRHGYGTCLNCDKVWDASIVILTDYWRAKENK